MEFYATAAQVIAVFFLAMTFESRLLMRLPGTYLPDVDPEDPSWWNPSHIVTAIYAALLMALGEFAALLGLYRGSQTSLLNALVWLGLGGGLLGVTLPVLRYQWTLLLRHVRTVGWQGIVLPGLVLVAFLLGTSYAVQEIG